MKIGDKIINYDEHTKIYYSVRGDLFTALSMEDWDEFSADIIDIASVYVGRGFISYIIEKDDTWF